MIILIINQFYERGGKIMATRKEVVKLLTFGILLILASLFLFFGSFLTSFTFMPYVLAAIFVLIGIANYKKNKGLAFILFIVAILCVIGTIGKLLNYLGIIVLIGGIVLLLMGFFKIKDTPGQ